MVLSSLTSTSKYEPTRMCIACRKKTSKENLLRYVILNTVTGEISTNEGDRKSNILKVLDEKKCLDGRGYYVCNDPVCIEKVQKIKMRKPKLKIKQEKSKKV